MVRNCANLLRRFPMTDSRYHLLLIATHPVQYASPMYREMARHPRLEIDVAYCSMQGAEAAIDKDFGIQVKWDVPLLDGYPWTQVPNDVSHPSLDRFFGLRNWGLWRIIRKGNYDAVVIYTGYRCVSFWIALTAAKTARTPVLFGTDATALSSRSGKSWKTRLKRWLWPVYFREADQILAPSTATREMLLSIGIPANRIALTPYVVDNDRWRAEAALVDRVKVGAAWK